jgi:TonB family protein
VRDARVKKSSSELFERNALAAVSKWRFEPEKEGGRPIPVRAAIKFTFK